MGQEEAGMETEPVLLVKAAKAVYLVPLLILLPMCLIVLLAARQDPGAWVFVGIVAGWGIAWAWGLSRFRLELAGNRLTYDSPFRRQEIDLRHVADWHVRMNTTLRRWQPGLQLVLEGNLEAPRHQWIINTAVFPRQAISEITSQFERFGAAKVKKAPPAKLTATRAQRSLSRILTATLLTTAGLTLVLGLVYQSFIFMVASPSLLILSLVCHRWLNRTATDY